MNRKGVDELPEDVIHVMINPAVWQAEELCLYVLVSRLFMVRFYGAVVFFVKAAWASGRKMFSGNYRNSEKNKFCPQKKMEVR